MWIASSVEFGPGIRLVALTRSRNAASVSQPRRRTTCSRIIAMCAAGPPNDVAPRRKNKRASSPREVRSARGGRSGSAMAARRYRTARYGVGRPAASAARIVASV